MTYVKWHVTFDIWKIHERYMKDTWDSNGWERRCFKDICSFSLQCSGTSHLITWYVTWLFLGQPCKTSLTKSMEWTLLYYKRRKNKGILVNRGIRYFDFLNLVQDSVLPGTIIFPLYLFTLHRAQLCSFWWKIQYFPNNSIWDKGLPSIPTQNLFQKDWGKI